ncbi:MAG: hypothetical protein KatS3mg057_2941 [Herpetosiphonaceae bacterium]|nr:MAG: hypothetical protein KatS3mg057_2941 [Herpetosiphonaceae bacterium]
MILADIQLQDIVIAGAAIIGAALLTALVGLVLLARRLRRLNLPPDAGALETLRAVPFGLVVVLDLLDLSLDIFSAPISWAILGRLGLYGLRQVTLIEALIPGTQLIPTMTLAWLFARYSGRGLPGTSFSTGGEGLVIDHDPSSSSRQRRHL